MKRPLFFSALFAIFLAVSCAPGEDPDQKDPAPTPFLNIDKSSVSFSPEGGSQSINVKSNESWTVSASASWLTVLPASGKGDASVTLTAKPSESVDALTCTVSFKCGSITKDVSVSQSGVDPVLVVGDVARVPAAGGEIEIDVEYNVEYDVAVEEAAKEWLSFIKTKAVSTGKLVFSVKENTAEEPRSGKATIKAKKGNVPEKTLVINQDRIHTPGSPDVSGSLEDYPYGGEWSDNNKTE